MENTSVKRSYADLFRKNKDLNMVIEDVNALHLRLEKFTLNLEAFKEQLSDLKLEISRSKAEENKKETSEQWKLRKTINIVGVPFCQNEKPREILMSICKFIEFEYNDDIFTFVSRMTSGRRKPTKVLLCVFSRVRHKRMFINCARAKSKDMTVRNIFNVNEETSLDCYVYVDEAMTARNRRLFREAKHFQKEGIVRYVWFRNGKVFYREHGAEPSFGIVTDESLQSWRVISDFFREEL